MCWPGWYGRVSGRSHRTSHLWRLLVSYVLNEQLKRETGAEVISAPVSLVRARPNLARCRMLRFRSGMAGLRLGKFQILAPPRPHFGRSGEGRGGKEWDSQVRYWGSTL